MMNRWYLALGSISCAVLGYKTVKLIGSSYEDRIPILIRHEEQEQVGHEDLELFSSDVDSEAEEMDEAPSQLSSEENIDIEPEVEDAEPEVTDEPQALPLTSGPEDNSSAPNSKAEEKPQQTEPTPVQESSPQPEAKDSKPSDIFARISELDSSCVNRHFFLATSYGAGPRSQSQKIDYMQELLNKCPKAKD